MQEQRQKTGIQKNDKNLKIIKYFPKSSEVFPNTDIKGGVVILYRDTKQKFGAIELFTSDEILTEIAKKVKLYMEKNKINSLKSITKVQTKMNLETVYGDFPNFKSVRPQCSILDVRLGTDAFSTLGEMFSTRKSENSIKILGLIKNKRVYRYINIKYLIQDKVSTNLNKYKIIIPKANGSGAIGEVLSTPLIGEPLTGHTMSFRSIGEAENALKYVKTKFCRAMIGVKKITQDMNPEVFEFVPLENFKSNSDINWEKSIPEIDKQLYKKYNLDEKQIEFIETKVKEMK